MARRNPQLSKRFGRVVRARRTALGMNQADLAFDSGLSTAYVSNVENGLKNPSLNTIAELAKTLGTTAADLIAEAEGKHRS